MVTLTFDLVTWIFPANFDESDPICFFYKKNVKCYVTECHTGTQIQTKDRVPPIVSIKTQKMLKLSGNGKYTFAYTKFLIISVKHLYEF